MARPRVFISSTFYDMRTLRDDLDRFVREHGFEPVRHESGHISYGKEEKPEHYAYREIDLCDILVCIIGGRYGTTSSDEIYSITQRELKTALDAGKQVYIFIDENVNQEHRFYLKNKSVPNIEYSAVDNPKVHEFIEEIYAVTKGNPIFTFSVSSNIMTMLQEQWAGLFQRLLQENAARPQISLIAELQRNLATVGQLVDFLTAQNNAGKNAISEILFANHPFFSDLRKKLNSLYRLYFQDLNELEEWLLRARGYTRSDDDDNTVPSGYYEWYRLTETKGKNRQFIVQIHKDLFTENGRLKPMALSDWKDEYLVYTSTEIVNDDDIPF